MSSVSDLQHYVQFLRTLQEAMGPDVSARQMLTLLHVAMAGEDGAEQKTLEQATDSSQSAASRNVRNLILQSKLAEYRIDPTDSRLRLTKLNRAGKNLIARIVNLRGK